MRLFGHPVHVMLVHFPVALWPAHLVLHGFASRLPPGVAAVGGFWLLVGGTTIGWAALACGVMDLVALAQANDRGRFRSAAIHGVVNGLVLVGFTALAILEYGSYPDIVHSTAWLAGESALIGAMFAGNYFGAKTIWDGA